MTKEGICSNGTTTTIRLNRKRQMGLPAPILSGPSILYLGLAAHKYSNKVHLSMLLLEEMLWMKWREYRPHSHTQRGTDKYTETFTITQLSSTALLPRLRLSAVLWLDSSPLTYSISQGCCGQIGRLVVWLPPPGMLTEDSFIYIKKKARTQWHFRTDICVHRRMTAHIHTGTVWYDSHVWPAATLLRSLWSALRSSVLCVLFTADVNETWKEWRIMRATIKHWWHTYSAKSDHVLP